MSRNLISLQACEGTPGWCDFEIKLCDDWHQEKDDVFDWTWKGGATNTRSTGPSADHTTRTSTGKAGFTSQVILILRAVILWTTSCIVKDHCFCDHMVRRHDHSVVYFF